MKKLTQEVFKDAPDWVKSAAVDSDGQAYWYSLNESDMRLHPKWWEYNHIRGAICDYVNDGYDTTNWQISAIDRDVLNPQSNTEKFNQLRFDINNAIDSLTDKFSDDTGISNSDVHIEVSVECYDESIK